MKEYKKYLKKLVNLEKYTIHCVNGDDEEIKKIEKVENKLLSSEIIKEAKELLKKGDSIENIVLNLYRRELN